MEELKKKEFRNMKLKTAKRLILAILIVLVFDFLLFPAPVLASESADLANIQEIPIIEEVLPIINNILPDSENWGVSRTSYHTISAYNSEVAQCDSTPCITANGFNLCENAKEDSVAANWLTFGTKIRIPDLFGDRVFIVRDRMNKRYSNRLDIWMIEKVDAKKFGIKIALIEILDH